MKFTQKDFEVFKKQCEESLQVLGLNDWHVKILFEKIDEEFLATASCRTTVRLAIIRLNTIGSNDHCDIKKVAKHEVLEVLLHCLAEMAEYGYGESVVDEARHSIIRRLEKIL